MYYSFKKIYLTGATSTHAHSGDVPFVSVGGIVVGGPSSSSAASLTLLLLQAKSQIIIMAPGLCGEDGWWCWWRCVCGEEGGGESQIVNGNCGLCQSAADGEHIFKRK